MQAVGAALDLGTIINLYIDLPPLLLLGQDSMTENPQYEFSSCRGFSSACPPRRASQEHILYHQPPRDSGGFLFVHKGENI